MLLSTLLIGCIWTNAVKAGADVDQSICVLTVDVDAGSCWCAVGVGWLAEDAAGDTYESVDTTGAPGLQSPGTTQSHDIAPGTFRFDTTWDFDGGTQAFDTGAYECTGGGYTNQHISCDCSGFDSGA